MVTAETRSGPGGLDAYREKRDFGRTPEPLEALPGRAREGPSRQAGRGAAALTLVVG